MTDMLIRTDRQGDVLCLTLDRPDRLNAAPPAMFEAITAALDRVEDARAVLIQGAGRAFCAGADVGGGALNAANPGEATFAALTRSYNPALVRIAALDVPVVSAVRGAAAGIGCSLALAADFCVASDTAYFLQAFVNIGLVPDGGASWMLPRLIGKARATEMMMLGERVLAAKAFEWGMIHRIVADDMLEREAMSLAQRLAAGPTRAYGAIRRQLLAGYEGDYAAAMALEAENQRAMRDTADASEGGRAFLEKRAPVFRGA
jgi:2-(1,2-epoxy-1,2-dihydrophenyl)acetyl-CoA isomerase